MTTTSISVRSTPSRQRTLTAHPSNASLLSASSSFVKLLGTRKARISQIGQKQSLPVLVSHSYTLRLSRERSIHSVFFGESVHLGVCTQNNCNFVRGRDQAQSRSDTRRSDMSLHRFSRTEFSPRVVSEGPLLAVNPPPIPDHCSSLVKGSGARCAARHRRPTTSCDT